MRGLLVKPEAEADLAEAYDWYEEQRPGLGEDLLLCVEAAIDAARRNPEMFPVVRGEARRALTRRFPYGVFYLVDPERIVVPAIYHSNAESRDPGRRKRTRLGERLALRAVNVMEASSGPGAPRARPGWARWDRATRRPP